MSYGMSKIMMNEETMVTDTAYKGKAVEIVGDLLRRGMDRKRTFQVKQIPWKHLGIHSSFSVN